MSSGSAGINRSAGGPPPLVTWHSGLLISGRRSNEPSPKIRSHCLCTIHKAHRAHLQLVPPNYGQIKFRGCHKLHFCSSSDRARSTWGRQMTVAISSLASRPLPMGYCLNSQLMNIKQICRDVGLPNTHRDMKGSDNWEALI